MLGRWQPWHRGHQALFDRCIAKTGQVIIQVRDVHNSPTKEFAENNPFNFKEVKKNILEGLRDNGYKEGQHFEVMLVPNIVNITYGRKVGYVIEEEVFDEEINLISATEIRKKLKITNEDK